MTQFVMAISRAGSETLGLFSYASTSYRRLKLGCPSREVVILGALLALVQILDGILTGIGVAHLGIAAEGNLFIRHLMVTCGYIPALVVTKAVALSVIVTLVYMSSSVRWLPTAMKVIIGIYLTAAIVPWSAVLLTHLS